MIRLTRFQLLCVFLLSAMVAANCGCDLGTYSTRAEAAAKNFKAADSPSMPTSDDVEKSDEPTARVDR